MNEKKVLVIGSSNMDLSLNVFKVPEAGETVIDDGGVAYTPGGKGANAAVAFAKLGANSVLSTKLGIDSHGRELYNYYKSVGIDTSKIKVDKDSPTGIAVVIKESGGENRIISYPGANLRITRENMTEAFSCMPDALYLNFEIGFSAAVAAAKIAESRGVPVFVDAAPADRNHPTAGNAVRFRRSHPPLLPWRPGSARRFPSSRYDRRGIYIRFREQAANRAQPASIRFLNLYRHNRVFLQTHRREYIRRPSVHGYLHSGQQGFSQAHGILSSPHASYRRSELLYRHPKTQLHTVPYRPYRKAARPSDPR